MFFIIILLIQKLARAMGIIMMLLLKEMIILMPNMWDSQSLKTVCFRPISLLVKCQEFKTQLASKVELDKH